VDSLRAYCSASGCLSYATGGAVEFAYAKRQRWHLCDEHMRPIRAALLPILHPPAAELEPVVPGGDDSTGFAT